MALTEAGKEAIENVKRDVNTIFIIFNIILFIVGIIIGGRMVLTPDGRVTINVNEEYVDYTYYTKTQYRLGALNEALLDRAKTDYPNGVDEDYNVYVIPRSNSITYRIYSPWDSLPTDIKEE